LAERPGKASSYPGSGLPGVGELLLEEFFFVTLAREAILHCPTHCLASHKSRPHSMPSETGSRRRDLTAGMKTTTHET
jgi:hypothetical protein